MMNYSAGLTSQLFLKVNYAKFQSVEVAREGMKTVEVDLLAEI